MDPEKKSNGALIGAVIIILILVIGGIYIWQAKVKSLPAGDGLESESVVPADTKELDALEQELDATELDVEANVINSVE